MKVSTGGNAGAKLRLSSPGANLSSPPKRKSNFTLTQAQLTCGKNQVNSALREPSTLMKFFNSSPVQEEAKRIVRSSLHPATANTTMLHQLKPASLSGKESEKSLT